MDIRKIVVFACMCIVLVSSKLKHNPKHYSVPYVKANGIGAFKELVS